MKIAYEHTKPRQKTLKDIEMINEVLEDIFVRQGYRLTLRQLFYQLVARGLMENTFDNYDKRLSPRCREGRMLGLIDWDAIEDRLRAIQLSYYVLGVEDALKDTISQYQLPRQAGQEYNIEIWVEKDAVSQIIGPVAKEYHIPFLVGRGQFSVSCLKESADRWNSDGRPVRVLYFGDHDPTGILSIEKNVRETMLDMAPELEQEIIRVAVPLNPGITELPPNSNPIKWGDTTAKKYHHLYGDKCWELEALTPAQLKDRLNKALRKWMNFRLYQGILDREKEDIKKLKRLIKRQ